MLPTDEVIMAGAFEEFAEVVQAAGFRARQCTPWHWQIRDGRFLVNYYPTSGKIYAINRHTGKGAMLYGERDKALAVARFRG